MHELEVLLSRLKMEHLSITLKACWNRQLKKELNYRGVPVHGATAGMERQASARYGVQRKQARSPWVKTLEQFDFTFQPGIDRKVVRELAGLAFVERSENVILLGPPVSENSSGHSSWRESGGCGTSGTVYATGQTDRTLMKAKQENRLERQLQQLSYARVLIPMK